MAYMNQEKKAKIKAALDPIMKEYKLKYSLGVNHHSSIVCNVKSGPIDFIKNHNETMEQRPGGFRNGSPAKEYIDVNEYWFQDHFTGIAKEAIGKIIEALNLDNFDHSDSMTDYFHVGHYVHLNIGRWNKPYILTE